MTYLTSEQNPTSSVSAGRRASFCRLLPGLLALLLTVFAFSAPACAAAAKVTVKRVSTWKSGKKQYAQYTVKLTNTGKKAINGWTVKLSFGQKSKVENGWNGVYSKGTKKTITVRPMSYNRVIPRGGSIEFGWIARSSKKTNWEKAVVTVVSGGKQSKITRQRKDTVKKAAVKTNTKTTAKTSTKTATKTSTKKNSKTTVKAGTTTKTSSGIKAKKATALVPANGRLQVRGGKLVNQNGAAVTLKGVSTHGINWYPEYVNKKAFQTMRDQWGVQCVRLAMYTAEYNGYCTGGDQAGLEKLIDRGVGYATELGMYVIIDWHILSDGNPARYQSSAVKFFERMAKKYSGYQNVIYEICNEPNGSVSWPRIKAYAQQVIGTIRAYDKNNLILVGTPTWSQDVDAAAKDPIQGCQNIMYTFHFYAATHGAAYRAKVQSALDAGLPVFVSEFGICDASGGGSLNKTEAGRWMSFLKKNGISYVCWNLSNKKESSALLKSSCKETGAFGLSDLSAHGVWFQAQ